MRTSTKTKSKVVVTQKKKTIKRPRTTKTFKTIQEFKDKIKAVTDLSNKKLVIKHITPDSLLSFLFLAGINRPVILPHIKRITKSIKKLGVIRPVIIARLSFIEGVEGHYIIDGQHLFTACLQLNINIPIVYITIKDQRELVEAIALLNSSSKSWTMKDYIRAWGSIYNDYKVLNKTADKYNMDVRFVANVLRDTGGASASSAPFIKNGTFKIVNKTKAEKYLKQLDDAFNIIPRLNRWENRTMHEVLYDIMRTDYYSHTKLLAFLRKEKNKLILATGDRDTLRTFFNKAFKK